MAMDFGKRLTEERKRLGLNQTEFGKIGGVTKTSEVNYESGERSPNVDYWQAVAAAGADVQYILTGIRSSSALPSDEMLLLERYRASSQQLKDAALRVLLNGEQVQAKFIVHGSVGQQVEGSQSMDNLTINMGNERKKK